MVVGQTEPAFRLPTTAPESNRLSTITAPTETTTPNDAPDGRRWLALVLLAAAQFVVVLDASITNVAPPSIGRDLQFAQGDLSWVVNSYVLTFGGFLLLGGRMADFLGRRRMFMVGLVIFGLASLAGGLAGVTESQAQLIIARAFQGIGAAIVSPAALSIVTTTFTEGAERNKALGVWGAVAGAGGAAGVLLGGMLTQWLSWEWVLYVNVPIVGVAALLAPGLLMESHAEGDNRRFDILGAASVTLGLSALVYALVDANAAGWGSGRNLLLLGVAAALLAAFVYIETHSNHPLVPFRIFSSRTLTGANISGLLLGASLFSMFFFVSLYMQQVLGYDALKAGLSYLPLALTIIAAAGVGSQLVTRFGFKPILITGLLLVATGLAWFSRISVDGTFLGDVLFPSVLAAAGLGFSFVSVTIGAVSGIRAEADAGLASGLINTSQQIGGALGLAVLAAVANGTSDPLIERARGNRSQVPAALAAGFQDAFLTGAGIALAGAIIAALFIRTADSRAMRGAEAVPVAA